jgi:hypothetical protein
MIKRAIGYTLVNNKSPIVPPPAFLLHPH